MRAGLYTVATDMHVQFHLMAQEAEQRGFDIIFTGEHTHIPVGSKVWSGGDLPPVYLGAKLRGETIRDMIELCDGWLPNAFMGGEHLAQDIARLKQEWTKAGRDAGGLAITVLHTAKSGENRRADDWGASPITEELLGSYEQAGVNTICVPLPPMGSRDDITRYFDDYSKRLARLLHA